MNMRRTITGFTLMEVLVAVAVLGIALMGVMSLAGQELRNVASLKERTVAQWVAFNRLTEVCISGQWPETGDSDGEVEMAQRQWHWELTVSETADEDLRRLDISISPAAEQDNVLLTISGFMGRPLPPLAPPGLPPPGSPGTNPPPDKK